MRPRNAAVASRSGAAICRPWNRILERRLQVFYGDAFGLVPSPMWTDPKPMWTDPKPDVDRSQARCGSIPSPMWTGPKPDVDRSQARCGPVPSPMWIDSKPDVDRSQARCGSVPSPMWTGPKPDVDRSQARDLGWCLRRTLLGWRPCSSGLEGSLPPRLLECALLRLVECLLERLLERRSYHGCQSMAGA